MKSSNYNVYRRDSNGYTVFNTFTWAVAQVDEETKTMLEKNPNTIPEDILSQFLKSGFVVEDDHDETKILAYYFDRDKYNVIAKDLGYTIAMTYACNLGCPYCYEGPKKDTETLTSERVEILLKNMEKNLSKKDFKILQIGLYGGEPLIAYDQCAQLMEGASAMCEQYNKELKGIIITNGVLITGDVVETLLKPYDMTVQITMDGGREAHNQRRVRKDGSGTYDSLLDILELLKDNKIDLDIRLNVDRENAHTFVQLFRDLLERKLHGTRTSMGWIHPLDTDRRSEGCPGYAEKCLSHEEMADFEDSIYREMDEMGILYKKPVITKHIPCTFDREDVYLVDPYLDLYKCWDFLGLKEERVGHIDGTSETVFYYRYFEQMSRNPLGFEECRGCEYLPLCGGGCAARAYLENGTFHSPSCGRYKYSIGKYIDEYTKSCIE